MATDSLGPSAHIQLGCTAPPSVTPADPTALDLHDAGLNTFTWEVSAHPSPTRWKAFIAARAPREHLDVGDGITSNLGVVLGRLSGNLAAIVCHTDAAFRRVGEQLEAQGIPLWAVRAGDETVGYYLVCVREGELRRLREGDVTVWGAERYVILPPSLDPGTGALWTWERRDGWLPPEVSVEALRPWLPARLRSEWARPEYVGPLEVLSRRTQRLLEHGAGGRQLSHAIYIAARDFDGCGFPQEVALERLRAVVPDTLAHHRMVEAKVEEAYGEDNLAARTYPFRLLHDWADTYRGKRNGTIRMDRLALHKLIDCAQEAGSYSRFQAAERRIADLMGVSRTTARGALQRLEADGVVVRVARGRNRMSIWSFAQSTLDLARDLQNETTIGLSAVFSGRILSHPYPHDAVRRLGLAYSVWLILEAEGGPLRPKDVAERCKIAVHQARYALKRLAAEGVVWQVSPKGSYVCILPCTLEWLDAMAEAHGWAGRGANMRARHEEQRREYAAYRSNPGKHIALTRQKKLRRALRQAGKRYMQ